MTPDHPSPTDPLHRALDALPRTESPSTTFTDRVLGELIQRGLVRRPHARRYWLAAAAVVFAAGLVTGAGATTLLVRGAESVGAVPASAASARNVPDIGHSEAWF